MCWTVVKHIEHSNMTNKPNQKKPRRANMFHQHCLVTPSVAEILKPQREIPKQSQLVLPKALTCCWFCSHLLILNSSSAMRWHQQNTLEMCTKSSWSPSWLRFSWDLVCCSCYCGLASMYEGKLGHWLLSAHGLWHLLTTFSPFFLVVLAVWSHSVGTKNRHEAQAGWDWTALTLWDHMDSGCLFTSKEDLYNLCCLSVNLRFSVAVY